MEPPSQEGTNLRGFSKVPLQKITSWSFRRAAGHLTPSFSTLLSSDRISLAEPEAASVRLAGNLPVSARLETQLWTELGLTWVTEI